MKVKLAHKIRLNPNPEQEKYFIQACHAARVVWNWALGKWNEQYEAGENPSAIKLDKQFNAIKHECFPWVCEVSKSVAQGAIRDLGQAFKNFFSNPTHFGRPRFKKKGKCKHSFYLQPGQFKIEGQKIRIPKLDKYTGKKKLKWVNMARPVRFEGRITGLRISSKAGKWYASVTVDYDQHPDKVRHSGEAIGVDLGILKLATISTGEVYENIQAMRKNQDRLRGLQKQLSRRKFGSGKWQETKGKIQNLHQKIENQRRDHIHKMTHYLTTHYGFIAIEDLNVTGMLKNHSLAKSISDASFGEIVRQIEYKAKRENGQVQKVGRFFPSSKTCSRCGWKNNQLKLNTRTYSCRNPSCQLEIGKGI